MARHLFKIHVPNLLAEIADNAGQPILVLPLRILQARLGALAKYAIELDDQKLNDFMMSLALYEQADPDSADFDGAALEESMKRLAA